MRYRSKVVERIKIPDRDEREAKLTAAGYNVFDLEAVDVYIDLLTDSGTGAMSAEQWAALFRGNEAYAGSDSFGRLRAAVEEVMGFDRIVPTHQGRGAENVLYGVLLEAGDVVLNNTHFDTTRAHIANQGADPVDVPVESAHEPDSDEPFKGNFSVERAREVVDDVGADAVPAVVLTITNNSAAGQPVSIANTRAVRAFADKIDATFVIDACRFAENAYFVQQRESGYRNESVADIAREQLGLADALVMSGKKDGLVNTGGFVAVRDADLFERVKQRAILFEGFPTYGGMAGRDLDAMAVGLREAVEGSYIADRIDQVQELADRLDAVGIPVYRPTGGHAVYVDAEAAVPHIPAERFPGQAFVCALYREGAVRAVELGSFAFPGTDRPELVRLAIPRRTYHREHLDHVAETGRAVMERRENIPGYKVVSEPDNAALRHFSADLRPIE